jgi:hypothetical protein
MNLKWTPSDSETGDLTQVLPFNEPMREWTRSVYYICTAFNAFLRQSHQLINQKQKKISLQIESGKLGTTRVVADLSNKHAQHIKLLHLRSTDGKKLNRQEPEYEQKQKRMASGDECVIAAAIE